MLKLAIRNLLRQKTRTGFGLLAIVFGVAGLILAGGFVRDMFIQLGEALIHSQTGHLQIAPSGYFDGGSGAPERFRIERSEALKAELEGLAQARSVMLRLHFAGLLGNGRSDWAVFGEGIEAQAEAALGSHLRLMSGRFLGEDDARGMMIGQGVAQALRLAPGDQASLLVNTDEGALNAIDFEVVGVFQTFSREFDARAVRIGLRTARELLRTEGANVVVVELRRTDQTDPVAASLRETFGRALQVRTWRELNDFYDKTVILYERQFGVLQVIVLAMVLLSVANAVSMSVFDRTGEFGTMMVLGRGSSAVFRLIALEGALLGLIGALLGALLGAMLALSISAIGIPMPPPPNANLGYEAYIRVEAPLIALAMLAGLLATVLATLMPAAKVARLPIADALRRNV